MAKTSTVAEVKQTETTIKIEALQDNGLLHSRKEVKDKNTGETKSQLVRIGFGLGDKKDVDPKSIKSYLVTDKDGNFVKKDGKHQFKQDYRFKFKVV